MAIYPELKKRIGIITGGANGIGEAMVRAFHQQGARVFFCDSDGVAGRRLEKELSREARFKQVDLTEEKEIANWISEVGSEEKRIDFLINNAARDPRIPLNETTSEAWDRLFALNLRAYFLVIRQAEPLLPDGGAIVNLSSLNVHTGPARMSAYVATKSAILGLTRSLARELGPRRIRVNAISPGWVMTERQLREFVTPAVKRLIKKSQCIPDLLQPDEIAGVAVFLASDAGRALTGQELLADRGWLLNAQSG